MTRKTLSLLALACAGVLALPGTASACQYTAWSSTTGTVGTTLVAGEPDDTIPVKRYSGKCASLSTTFGNFAQDNSPGAEKKYFVQFYLFTGVSGANPIRVFQGDRESPSAGTVISVDYTPSTQTLLFTAGGTQSFTSIATNKWYMIQMSWDAQTNNNMTVSVQGAAAASKTTKVVTGVVGTDQIDNAKLGWITGAGTASPGIITDAFISQRATAPGRLKRADADNSGACNANDISRIGAEVIGALLNQPNLSPGQPDCDEDGIVNANDISCTGQVVIGDLLNNKVCGD